MSTLTKTKSYWSGLSFRLSAAFLAVSAAGIALAAFLAYRSGNIELNSFINSMGGMGGMMGLPLAQARQNYLNGIASFLWVAGGAGVVLSLILGWIFSRQIVQPLNNVAEAARRVAEGDLEQNITIRSYDEIQDLETSFNHMAATLRQDRILRQNMIADIAHELRTPISVLQGNIEGLIDGILPDTRETLEALHNETLELARLVEDLRTLSLVEAGQLQFDLQPVDLAQLGTRVIESFKGLASSRGVGIEADFPAKSLTVKADPMRTVQVIRNLIDNALKYSPSGVSVLIKLTRGNGMATFSVTDQGAGIPAENLPFVFDRFYRVDRSRSRSTGGSGLGLAIAKQLVESQGGTIRAESRPGKGSIFSFSLPRHE